MDTISDMLTRIRNAQAVKKAEVLIPFSKFKNNLAKILAAEGWIKEFSVKEDGIFKQIVVKLKYDDSGSPVITGIKRVSKPGQRIYTKTSDIPRTLGGVGVTIVSTSKGLMTDRTARASKVGGEVVCQVW